MGRVVGSSNWADEMSVYAAPPVRGDARIRPAIAVIERHLACALTMQVTPRPPLVPVKDALAAFDAAVFDLQWNEERVIFTTAEPSLVWVIFAGVHSRLQRTGSAMEPIYQALHCALLLEEPIPGLDPATLLADLGASLQAWHGCAGPYPAQGEVVLSTDGEAAQVPSRLGWLNLWSERSCELLGFPSSDGDQEWSKLAGVPARPLARLLRLTDEPLDLTRPDHQQAVARAERRFGRIGRTHEFVPLPDRRDQS